MKCARMIRLLAVQCDAHTFDWVILSLSTHATHSICVLCHYAVPDH